MKITQAVNQSLPDEMLSLLQTMGKVAAGQNIHLYLVGGAARNCFIKQATIVRAIGSFPCHISLLGIVIVEIAGTNRAFSGHLITYY